MGYFYATNESYLSHHGVSGQKWGMRRYQNEDGSLTPLGMEHYMRKKAKIQKKMDKTYDKLERKLDKNISKQEHKFKATNAGLLRSFKNDLKESRERNTKDLEDTKNLSDLIERKKYRNRYITNIPSMNEYNAINKADRKKLNVYVKDGIKVRKSNDMIRAKRKVTENGVTDEELLKKYADYRTKQNIAIQRGPVVGGVGSALLGPVVGGVGGNYSYKKKQQTTNPYYEEMKKRGLIHRNTDGETFYATNDNTLCHWKYISREKKNGQWVYTYPEDVISTGGKHGHVVTPASKVKDAVNNVKDKFIQGATNRYIPNENDRHFTQVQKNIRAMRMIGNAYAVASAPSRAANNALNQMSQQIRESQTRKENAKQHDARVASAEANASAQQSKAYQQWKNQQLYKQHAGEIIGDSRGAELEAQRKAQNRANAEQRIATNKAQYDANKQKIQNEVQQRDAIAEGIAKWKREQDLKNISSRKEQGYSGAADEAGKKQQEWLREQREKETERKKNAPREYANMVSGLYAMNTRTENEKLQAQKNGYNEAMKQQSLKVNRQMMNDQTNSQKQASSLNGEIDKKIWADYKTNRAKESMSAQKQELQSQNQRDAQARIEANKQKYNSQKQQEKLVNTIADLQGQITNVRKTLSRNPDSPIAKKKLEQYQKMMNNLIAQRRVVE